MAHFFWQSIAEPIEPQPNPPSPDLAWQGVDEPAPLRVLRPMDYFFPMTEPIPNPAVPETSWLPTAPERIDLPRALGPGLVPAWMPQPGFPVPVTYTSRRRSNQPVLVLPIDEQESGSVLATLVDEAGRMLPGSLLTDLRLTVLVETAAGTFQVVNGRDQQFVLNANQVQVYDVLQSTGTYSYNLRWRVQPADTTLVEAVAFARHMALFTYTWAQGQGQAEVHLIVRNLGQVS